MHACLLTQVHSERPLVSVLGEEEGGCILKRWPHA